MNELRENRERGKMIDELIEKAVPCAEGAAASGTLSLEDLRAVAKAAYARGAIARVGDARDQVRREFAREAKEEVSDPGYCEGCQKLFADWLREQAGEEA